MSSRRRALTPFAADADAPPLSADCPESPLYGFALARARAINRSMSSLIQSFLDETDSADDRFDAPGSRPANSLFWRLQLIGWGLIGAGGWVFWAGVFGPLDAAFLAAVRALLGIGVTCGLRELYRRAPWRRLPPWALLCGTALISVTLGLAETAFTRTHVFIDVRAQWPAEVLPVLERVSVLLRCGTFFGWSVLYFAIRFWRESTGAALRGARLEAALRTAELRQLQAQINPHFLFNALNSILAEKDDARSVERITGELADYLRHALRSQEDLAPLGAELDLLERYLRVEKSRFEERLQFTITATPDARAARVPAALVQPLLENACKYGRRTGPRILEVRIDARIDERALVVEVVNTGRWLQTPSDDSHGIGLANLRRRLALLSHGRARLEHREADGRVHVAVIWPLAPRGRDGA